MEAQALKLEGKRRLEVRPRMGSLPALERFFEPRWARGHPRELVVGTTPTETDAGAVAATAMPELKAPADGHKR